MTDNPKVYISEEKFVLQGKRKNLVFNGNVSIAREPWPFFDVKGGGIEFGNNVTISAGVYVLTHSHQFHKSNWRSVEEVRPENPTIIEDKVFLGVNAVISHSCKRIGRSSVIGCGSVVTKDVPAYEIWAGNPAKCVGKVDHI